MAIEVTKSEGILQSMLFADELTGIQKERLQEMRKVIGSSLQLIEENRTKIQASIAQGRQKTADMFAKCQAYTVELTAKVLSEEVTDADFTKGSFLMALASEVNKRYFETTAQLMQISQLCEERNFAQDKGVMEIFFLERMRELDVHMERVKLLAAQQDHALEVETIVHQQKLKEESQRFDQFLAKAQFSDQQKQAEFDRQRRVREQQRLEDKTYQDLAVKRAQIQNHYAQEVARLNQAKADALSKIN